MKKFYGLAFILVLVGAGCVPGASVRTTPEPQADGSGQVQQEGIAVVEVDLLTDGLYQLDVAKSSIRWQASKVRLGHVGTILPREGFVRIDQGTATEGSVLVDMNTLKNLDQEGELLKMLEDDLRSPNFFDVAQFPTSSFVVKTIEPISGLEGVNYRIDGQMTIKNVTNDLSFPVSVKEFNGGLRLTGRATIDRTLYGIKFGSGKFFQNLGDALIDDNFYLDLDLTFLAQEEAVPAGGEGIKGS